MLNLKSGWAAVAVAVAMRVVAAYVISASSCFERGEPFLLLSRGLCSLDSTELTLIVTRRRPPPSPVAFVRTGPAGLAVQMTRSPSRIRTLGSAKARPRVGRGSARPNYT
ncbi:hypothetical protein FIBSPDRAFT_859511 [Athelia psychrophila]|uniref:Uncharacterized protein n=1 Tax=Athelia psychrophila TaxID=1759441 RepID=A0A166L0G7_9AGAM|nr:hypothetical protein FIBSPDRAFT_859511 [Fibularhizoctonia sp. CBS 109695]